MTTGIDGRTDRYGLRQVVVTANGSGSAAGPELHLLDLPRLSIDPEEVHVWWIEVNEATRHLDALIATLDNSELGRAARFARECDRIRFIVAHGALRRLLAVYLDQPASALTFRHGRFGKPMLDQPTLGFNLSHSGNLVGIAIAPAKIDVGIDVERMRPVSNPDGLIRHCLSLTERATWHALPAAGREAAFFRLWTCKEAVLKATGEGLTRRMNSISLGFAEPDPYIPEMPGLSVRILDIVPPYAAALALAPRDSLMLGRARVSYDAMP